MESLNTFQIGLIALACSISIVVVGVVREKYRAEIHLYRSLIATPEDLLSGDVDFFIMERPNDDVLYVHILGVKFQSKIVFSEIMRDLCCLSDLGYKTQVFYLYDSREPPSEEDFARLLAVYESKLSVWRTEDQGRPSRRTRPLSPYDFKKTVLCRYSARTL